MKFRIRRAVLEDLESLTEIYNQAIVRGCCTCDTEVFTPDQRQGWFEEHNNSRYPLFAVVSVGVGGDGVGDGELVVGYAYYSPYRVGRRAVEHVAEISYYLANDIQGQGCGSFVMEFLLANASSLGFSELLTILLANNSASIALLEKYGFERWGCLPGIVHIGGERIDHLYYGRSLG